MKPRVWVRQINFNDGTELSLDKNDIIVFVGPNNSGKSISLTTIEYCLKSQGNRYYQKVINDIIIEKEGDISDLALFLKELSIKPDFMSEQEYHGFAGYNFSISAQQAKNIWENFNQNLGELSPVFVNSITTLERLKAANPPENIRITSHPPVHPIHFLQKDDSLEKQFSMYFRQAFNKDLIVHRNAGKEVPLYVGDKPNIINPDDDRTSIGYLKELEKLDTLQNQGDGMRSFVGVLLSAIISYHSILFIDEPEAFLHPPQARLIGKMLAKELPTGRQLFLATHSDDFLKGLIDANTPNLKIIRIQRNDNINKISVLDNSEINKIWNDSLLRHSNILSGLFHSKVVVCESDSDCQFYSAMFTEGLDISEMQKDALFIHCGGKHRVPKAIETLKKLDVPLKVISDFDVLNNDKLLKEIYEGLGGKWKDIENYWKIINSSIVKKKPELLTDELKNEIMNIFNGISDKVFPTDNIEEIQNLLKRPSAWSKAKKMGKAFIPSGEATEAFEKLQEKLKEKGLLIPEVGEMECFVKSVGNKSTRWVSAVLTKNLKNDPKLEDARKFVGQILLD